MQRSPAFGSRARRASAITGLLCAALVPAAQATNHLLRMDEIMAALEGDPSIRFRKRKGVLTFCTRTL
jgi:hypothetical protein